MLLLPFTYLLSCAVHSSIVHKWQFKASGTLLKVGEGVMEMSTYDAKQVDTEHGEQQMDEQRDNKYRETDKHGMK